MKNLLLILLVAFSVSGDLMAQKSRETSTTTSTDAVRADRKVGISASLGFKSLSGVGLMGSYYVTPHVAIDVGAGFGTQLLKTGIRGRYLITKKRFTPYIGAGLNYSPVAVNDVEFEDINGSFATFDLSPSTYGQLTAGFEFMGNGGFLFGFDIGYSALLNKDNVTITGTPIDNATQLAIDIIYGNSLNFSMSMGYAF